MVKVFIEKEKMSGHSKWSTIKRKKGVNALNEVNYLKLIRGIEVAAKNGGVDPDNNASLYKLYQKLNQTQFRTRILKGH